MAIDTETLAKQFGGSVVSPTSQPVRVEISGTPIFAESERAASITPPEGFKLLPIELADAKPQGTFYDQTSNAFFTPISQAPELRTEIPPSPPVTPVDLTALAAEYGGTVVGEREPSTTATGLAGAATRGLALPAAGALAGGAAGLLLGGVGAIPGAIAGAGAATLAQLVADPVVGSINSLFGTKYTMPTDALEDLLTRVGVAEPRTAAERIVQTTTAGASGGAGGVALGKAVEAAAAGPVAREVGRLMATTPTLQTVTGGTSAAAGGLAKESGASTGGQIAAQVAGAFVPSVPSAVKTLTGQAAKLIAPAGAQIREQVTPVTIEQLRLGYTQPAAPTMRESLQSIKATVEGKISPQEQETLKKVITQNPDSVDTVNFRVAGTQVVPDNLAADAIKQGWKDGTIASIKAATAQDRKAMLQMLNIFKMGEKSEVFRSLNRAADILGDTVQRRIDFLANANKTSGKAIDRIAQTKLRGQSVNFDPAINTFLDDLSKIGVKVELDAKGVAKANLQGSRIEGDTRAEKLLNIVLKRMSKTDAPDALGVHDAKRFIDTQVNYGKKNLANPLTAEAERVVKGLRRNLNKTLGDAFPVYKAANEKYADTITALDDLQKAAGTQIDFDSENANKALGTAMRKLTSNYGTRANLIDALDQANQAATKYGMKIEDDIVNQLIFVNELDRMFGAAAQTSLKGQVAEAMQTGVDIARGGAARRALELLAEKAEELRGINKENAIKAIEELLKRK
jgi:small nuclear ribonucleoprotein (snRNP)-like protein